jgi:hypothetical protein
LNKVRDEKASLNLRNFGPLSTFTDESAEANFATATADDDAKAPDLKAYGVHK